MTPTRSSGFRIRVEEDGTFRAGGIKLFRADPDGSLVFDDDYLARCRARKTDDVPITVGELLGALLLFYSNPWDDGWSSM